MEDNDDRQKLLDQLGATLGALFAKGLSESPEPVARSVMHGLECKRVQIDVRITLPPLRVCFAVVDPTGATRIDLFEIADLKARPLRVDHLPPGASDVVN